MPRHVYFVDSVQLESSLIIRTNSGNDWVLSVMSQMQNYILERYDGSGDEYFLNNENVYLYLPLLIEASNLETAYMNDNEVQDMCLKASSFEIDYSNTKRLGLKASYYYLQEPDSWLLFLIRGDIYNDLAGRIKKNCKNKPLSFKNPHAYYKVLFPYWDKK
ncbi:MAG: hypothetical protein KBT10_02860 [Bacteroidales bacterium]|nr:hypothetical protein [Candidatus Sodaliphilus aphodohippi]